MSSSPGAKQTSLHLTPRPASTRISFLISQAAVQLLAVLRGEHKRIGLRCDAVPNVLDELNAFGHAQPEDVGDRISIRHV